MKKYGEFLVVMICFALLAVFSGIEFWQKSIRNVHYKEKMKVNFLDYKKGNDVIQLNANEEVMAESACIDEFAV